MNESPDYFHCILDLIGTYISLDQLVSIVTNVCAIVLHRDFSNNHIGGYIPSNLPVTMQNLYVFSLLQT